MKKLFDKLPFVARAVLLICVISFVWIVAYYIKEQIKPREPLRIAISSWVGYMPIVYAKEKEWLDDSDIQLLWTESLKTSSAAFDRRLVDGMFVTQYDYVTNQDDIASRLVLATDISRGADSIMSNVTLEELRSSERVLVTLEQNSLGQAMFNSFVAKYDLNASKFSLSNHSQLGIVDSNYTNTKAIAITYPPYVAMLKKKGFSEITNAKKLQLPVLDGLFVSEGKINTHGAVLVKIADACERAIGEAKKNPMQFYQVVKPYLAGIDYDEFIVAMGGIEWADKNNSTEINSIISKYNIKVVGRKQ